MSRLFDASRLPLLMAVVLGIAPVPLLAATFTVNTTGDAGDIDPNDGICDSPPDPGEQCTLSPAAPRNGDNQAGEAEDCRGGLPSAVRGLSNFSQQKGERVP